MRRITVNHSREVFQSAKRTNENSPAIYRWESKTKVESQSAKRTTERWFNALVSVAPFTGFGSTFLPACPALKCWAIFTRPLRGLSKTGLFGQSLSTATATVLPRIPAWAFPSATYQTSRRCVAVARCDARAGLSAKVRAFRSESAPSL